MTDTQTLLSIVEGLGRPKVVIIGDLIIDRYISGEVTRIFWPLTSASEVSFLLENAT